MIPSMPTGVEHKITRGIPLSHGCDDPFDADRR